MRADPTDEEAAVFWEPSLSKSIVLVDLIREEPVEPEWPVKDGEMSQAFMFCGSDRADANSTRFPSITKTRFVLMTGCPFR
ncbi:hypothetical protein RRSWK_03374 [Rhodopirellula sp. SWK7]|nr:hypothetical protein RRSWK_03374 [Rhodopirellula sp. SWK7]